METKNLNYYLNLDYDVIISRHESEDLVSYKAYSRELDPYVFYGVGDTKQEALLSFEETKAELFELYLDEGRPIPEPTREDDSLPSGQFVLRIDPAVHLRLRNLAKEAKKSLNSYVDQVLVAHVTGEDLTKTFEPMILRCLKSTSVKYNIIQDRSPIGEQVSEAYCKEYSGEIPMANSKYKKVV